MSARSVARRYARALFELEQEGAKIRAGLNAVAQVAGQEDVRRLLAEPRVPDDAKARVLIKAAGKVSPEIERLVALLCQRGKAALLPEIAALFEEMTRQAANEVEAQVVSAIELDDATRDGIAKALGKALGGKVNLAVRVDPDILGGLVIRVGDRQLDYSLRTRLQSLKRAMLA